MNTLSLALISLVFVLVGAGICIYDVIKHPPGPSLSDTYLIGMIVLTLGVLVGAV